METLVTKSYVDEDPTCPAEPPLFSELWDWDARAFEPEAFGLRPNLPFTLDELEYHLEALGIEIKLPFDLDQLEAQGLLPKKIPSGSDVGSNVVLYANPVTADRKGDEFACLCPPAIFIGTPQVFDGLVVDDGGLSDDEVEDTDDDDTDEEEGGDGLDHAVNSGDVWLRRTWTTLARCFGCLPH